MSLYASNPGGTNAGDYTNYAWGAPMKSYAKVFNAAAAGSPLDIPGHDVTFAENVCANLFTQINVKINNIII